MATFTPFEEIKARQKAGSPNKRIGEIIDAGKFKGSYRPVHQTEGSAGAVTNNIREGVERCGNREFLTFLHVAEGSRCNTVNEFKELYGVAKTD